MARDLRPLRVREGNGEMTIASVLYRIELQKAFRGYRERRFAGHENWFDKRPEPGPIVFNSEHAENNLLIPPCTQMERNLIVATIPRSKRHRHFGSMQSSQALAQSVFGTIAVLNRLPCLASVKSDDGSLAFGSMKEDTRLELEKDIHTLGERASRTTSVDVWLEGDYRVAIECKLAEVEFGSCSRPRLESENEEYCDGSYRRQKERIERCSLTEIGIQYWSHAEELFGWSSEIDYPQCPMNKTYQLVRNILAARVGDDKKLRPGPSHALIIYDQRNPAMAIGGAGECAWRNTYGALRDRSILRRLSWQHFIAQWPNDVILNWLQEELGAKYGLRSS